MRGDLDRGYKGPWQAVKSCGTAASLRPPRGCPSLGCEDGGEVALGTPKGQRGFPNRWTQLSSKIQGRQVWGPGQAQHAPAGPPCLVPSLV